MANPNPNPSPNPSPNPNPNPNPNSNPRAKAVTELLVEMNSDVEGCYRDADPSTGIIERQEKRHRQQIPVFDYGYETENDYETRALMQTRQDKTRQRQSQRQNKTK
jgi:hypothetical protein